MSVMSEATAINVLTGFKKNLKPGCDIDLALDVAIGNLKKPHEKAQPQTDKGGYSSKPYQNNKKPQFVNQDKTDKQED